MSKPVKVDRPLFLIGCGRSGTTLLYEALGRHPELGWFSNISQRYPKVPATALASRLAEVQPVRARFRRHPIPAEAHAIFDAVRGGARLADEGVLGRHDVAPEEAARLRGLVATHLRLQGKRRFMNKNTRNARRVGYLAEVFPEALFVHVVRDPRATAASLLKVPFWPDLRLWWKDYRTPADLTAAGESPALLAAEFWRREVDQIDADGATIDPARWMEIRYEDLVGAFAEQVRLVTRFAQLEDSPTFDRRLRELEVSSRNDKFRRLFSSEDLAAMWALVEPTARRHGYEPLDL